MINDDPFALSPRDSALAPTNMHPRMLTVTEGGGQEDAYPLRDESMKTTSKQTDVKRDVEVIDIDDDEKMQTNERPNREAVPRKLKLAQEPSSQNRLDASKSKGRPLIRR